MYSIIDIEYTPKEDGTKKIIDIAVYNYDGYQITEQFFTLVNPEIPIDYTVRQITGITDKMLRKPPKFHEVAKRLIKLFDQRILVSHGVINDFAILNEEFMSLGYYDFTPKTLCTQLLTQKIMPDLERYTLKDIAASLGIVYPKKHRAMEDAFATMEVLKVLIDKDVQRKYVDADLKQIIHPRKKLVQLAQQVPYHKGVFFFLNKNGRVIYADWGLNMRTKVYNYLSKLGRVAQRIKQQVYDIRYERHENSLIAQLRVIQLRQRNVHQQRIPIPTKTSIPLEEETLLIAGGRHVHERCFLYFRRNLFQGYGYYELHHQIENRRVFFQKLIPIHPDKKTNSVLQKYLKSYSWHIKPIATPPEDS